MITDRQIEALLAEYLCARRRERQDRAWKHALDLVATVCSKRADGNAVAFLLGVARHAIAVTSGHQVDRIIEVYGKLQEQCATPGEGGTPLGQLQQWLADAVCGMEQAAGNEPLVMTVRALLRKLPLDKLRGLTVDRLARKVGLSRTHLSAKLHEEGDVTPHQLILAERLRRAIVMLGDRSAAMTVDEASRLAGFADVHYFRRVFHEIFGVPPSAFR